MRIGGGDAESESRAEIEAAGQNGGNILALSHVFQWEDSKSHGFLVSEILRDFKYE